jgi:hypothetical protein
MGDVVKLRPDLAALCEEYETLIVIGVNDEQIQIVSNLEDPDILYSMEVAKAELINAYFSADYEIFLEKLDQLRHQCGFPFIITSGYRDPSHSIEARKTRPGTHARGIAADIKINSGSEGYVIVREAMKMGFGGIGIAKNFIHVDVRDTVQVIWTY